MAISRSRALARLSSRLARLPQAISSSTPTIPSKAISGRPRSSRSDEMPPDAASSTMRSLATVARSSSVPDASRLIASRWCSTVSAAATSGTAPASGTRDRIVSHSIAACGGHGLSGSAASDVLAFDAYRTDGCIISGTQISGLRNDTIGPKNSGAATPTIVSVAPLTIICLPTAVADRL